MITTIQNYSEQDIEESIRYLLAKASKSEAVRQQAVQIIAGAPDPILAIHSWVRENLSYIPDPVNNGQEIEMFTSPVKLVNDHNSGHAIGEDCDSHAILTVALFQSIGIAAHVVLAGYNGNDFEHAYCQVFSQPLDRWIDVDTTTDYPVGWVHPTTRELVV